MRTKAIVYVPKQCTATTKRIVRKSNKQKSEEISVCRKPKFPKEKEVGTTDGVMLCVWCLVTTTTTTPPIAATTTKFEKRCLENKNELK